MSHIILIGPPGCGKGTISKYITNENKKISHLSTGDLLRKEKNEEIKNTLKKGCFVSDECITSLVIKHIKETSNILLLDGFPRTLNQAKNFNIEYVKLVIVLKADDIVCIERIRNRNDKREDDKDLDVVKKRISIYHSITEPVIDYYKKKDLVEYVEGNDEVEKVYERIRKILKAKEIL